MSIATTSNELWTALRGLLCLHKPSGRRFEPFVQAVNDKLIKQINDYNPDFQNRIEEIEKIQDQNGLIDYASHPHVLGDAFDNQDFIFEPINELNEFTSGLCLITVNAPEIYQAFKDQVLLRQYLLHMELGKATDNSFSHGKVLEKSTFQHLINRPQILEKQLAKIVSSHQRDAFFQAGVSLRSKEAYNLAVKGLVRPIKEHAGYTLIYGLDCVHYKPPDITLKVTCINESPIYLAEFCAELGLLLRTNAVLKALQLVRYGPFTSENTLLEKHVNLRNAIHNIYDNYETFDVLSHVRKANLSLS